MVYIEHLSKYLIGLVCLTSCGGNKDVQTALDEAGDNRPGLELLLSETESVEHRAVEFLIANMPGRGSFDGRTYRLLDSLLAPIGNRESWEIYADGRAAWNRHNYLSRPMSFDIQTLSPAYISDNVGDAVSQWKSRPWNATLSEADFMEYLLPYRSGDEPITDWRNVYRNRFGDSTDCVTDVVEAAGILAERLAGEPYRYNEQLSRPHRSALSLLDIRAGNCVDDCDRTLYAMRSCGVPSAIDMFLVSPDNGGSHRWNVLIDNVSGHAIPFDIGDRRPSREPYREDYRRKAKVYRLTYGIQRDRQKTLASYPHAPGSLRNVKMRDVTSEYFGHNEVAVPVNSAIGDELYLGIFTPGGYKVVDFGKRSSQGTVKFTDLEPDLIYFPMAYNEVSRRIIPAGDAFSPLSGGGVRVFTPDASAGRTVRLRRKMPLRPQLAEWMESGVVGCRIEGSDSLDDDGDWDLLYEFDKPLDRNYHVVNPALAKAYRYYRIVPPSERCLQLAEIEFFGDHYCVEPIEMDITSSIDDAETKVADGDLLTYYIFSPERYRIVFKNISGKPLKSVALSARNDDNYVWPDQQYELLYFDKGQWRSCGRRVADEHYVEFDAPENAVFWLRNLSKGREEQVFIYRDGRQLFNMDLRGAL
ncbi:MAG: hypothetical protein NC127_05275 [Muribaculum sp.]|nr:hypothetical protein [Muribaculum sp.]